MQILQAEVATLKTSLSLLNRKDRKKLYILTLAQTLVSVLDLIGIALVGVIGALAVRGVQSASPGSRLDKFLSVLQIENSKLQVQVALLGVIAAFFLIFRTLISMVLAKKTLFFLGRRSADVSSKFCFEVLNNSMKYIRKSDPQNALFAITSGVEVVVVRILGAYSNLFVDFTLLIFLFITLFIVSPILASGTLAYFFILGLILVRILHNKAITSGNQNTELHIASVSRILQSINAYREIEVWHRQARVSQLVGESRKTLAESTAEVAFLPGISKYVIEIAMVVSIFLLSASQFLLTDATQAVATLGIFIASGMRIAPAVLRIQQGLLQIRSATGQASPTFEIARNIVSSDHGTPNQINTVHTDFKGSIKVINGKYSFPNSASNVIDCLNLEIKEGTSLAIVGKSGVGKSTLIDLILGLLQPLSGTILINDLPPREAFRRWPGAVSYVPQEVSIINGTIRENILFTLEPDPQFTTRIEEVIQISQLSEWVDSLPAGLDTVIGDSGIRISGGQAQRIGIARALITKPKIVVLDEATSALDGKTEADLSKAFTLMKRSLTLIVVAHRLSTVRDFDNILYLGKDNTVAQGSFESIKSSIPDFGEQAKLMGL